MNPKKVAILIGSLRKASVNRKMAHVLIQLAPAWLQMEIVEIADLAIYNEDLDLGDPPAAWKKFRDAIKDFHGVLFVTPEYNRSVPAVLKNALDIGSRPYGQSVWAGKPGAVMTVSPGAIGGFGANHHLRQSLVFLDVPCLQQPESYIGGAGDLFDAQGQITKPATQEFLQRFITTFAQWVQTNSRHS